MPHYFGIVAVILGLSSILLFGHITPNYSHLKDYTSYLGMKDKKYHKLMNSFGFILPGIFLGLYSLYLIKNTKIFGDIGAIFLLVSGLYWMLIGFYPYNPKDKKNIHEKVVDRANLFSVLSICMFFINSIFNGPVWFLLISLSIILLLTIRLFTKFETKVIKNGLVQKIIITFFFVWVVCLSLVYW